MKNRLAQELELLRTQYTDVQHQEVGGVNWYKVEGYKVPSPWQPDEIPVVFSVTPDYPGNRPYGFYVPLSLHHNGDKVPGGSQNALPFPGEWLFVSHEAVDWQPKTDVESGSNLWGFTRTFKNRLAEGPT